MAFTGCRGTLEIDDEEVMGITNWSWTEEVSPVEVNDNTTGCVPGVAEDSPLAINIEFGVNLQEGADKGKMPVRAGARVTLKMHIDDTDANYWEVEALILTGGTTLTVSNELVTSPYTARGLERPVGHGTLEDGVS